MDRLYFRRISRNWFEVSSDRCRLNAPAGGKNISDSDGFAIEMFVGDELTMEVRNLGGKPKSTLPNRADVKRQAAWELFIEQFEQAVEAEKEKLRNRKSWFPWRLRLINVNEVTK